MVVLSAALSNNAKLHMNFSNRQFAAAVAVVQILVLIPTVVFLGHDYPVNWLVTALALTILAGQGQFRTHLELSVLDRLPGIIAAFASAIGISACVVALRGHQSAAVRALEFAPVALLVSVLTFAVCFQIGLLARRRGWVADRLIIVGTGRVAGRIERVLRLRPEYGIRVIGQIADQVPGDPFGEAEPATGLAQLSAAPSLAETCQEYRASMVVVAYSQTREGALLAQLRECALHDVRVYVVPRFFEDLDRHDAADSIWGLPLHRLPMPNQGRVRRTVKRTLDLVLAGFAFVMLLPVMLVVGLLIRRETGGSVLFRQVRVGLSGQPIEMLKFQTLKPATAVEGDTTWNISHDDRLGPFGRFLRKTSIDELPQLWNVLRGDMSLVGPRPERPHFVEQFKATIPSYDARHRVPVGLTGLAQVNRLRGDSSIEERASFDNLYASSWTPWEDIKILLKTVPEVFKGSGG